MLVKCSSCGKLIERKRVTTINKYGIWESKCGDCKKNRIREHSFNVWKEEQEKLKDIIITPEEMRTLSFLHSYPVIIRGSEGTGDPSTNLKIIIIEGIARIKGAVWLEEKKKEREKRI